MPTILFYRPKLDKEKRKEMIKSFTDTASRLTGIEESASVVYLRQATPEDVGVGGELLEDVSRTRRDYEVYKVDPIAVSCLLETHNKKCRIISESAFAP